MAQRHFARNRELAKRNKRIQRAFKAQRVAVADIAQKEGLSESSIYVIGNNPNAVKVRS